MNESSIEGCLQPGQIADFSNCFHMQLQSVVANLLLPSAPVVATSDE
jgi:hypothetical protein